MPARVGSRVRPQLIRPLQVPLDLGRDQTAPAPDGGDKIERYRDYAQPPQPFVADDAVRREQRSPRSAFRFRADEYWTPSWPLTMSEVILSSTNYPAERSR